MGIVGLGRIGVAVARQLAPFCVSRFLYSGHSPKDEAKEVGAEFVDFDTLLGSSDFVLECCALTKKKTKDFPTKRHFRK